MTPDEKPKCEHCYRIQWIGLCPHRPVEIKSEPLTDKQKEELLKAIHEYKSQPPAAEVVAPRVLWAHKANDHYYTAEQFAEELMREPRVQNSYILFIEHSAYLAKCAEVETFKSMCFSSAPPYLKHYEDAKEEITKLKDDNDFLSTIRKSQGAMITKKCEEIESLKAEKNIIIDTKDWAIDQANSFREEIKELRESVKHAEVTWSKELVKHHLHEANKIRDARGT